jgi:hypothetical protein
MSARNTPGRRHALDVKGFFYCHGQSEQRTMAARVPFPVRVEGRLSRAVEVSDNDRVDVPVNFLDACDRSLDQIERCDIFAL